MWESDHAVVIGHQCISTINALNMGSFRAQEMTLRSPASSPRSPASSPGWNHAKRFKQMQLENIKSYWNISLFRIIYFVSHLPVFMAYYFDRFHFPLKVGQSLVLLRSAGTPGQMVPGSGSRRATPPWWTTARKPASNAPTRRWRSAPEAW